MSTRQGQGSLGLGTRRLGDLGVDAARRGPNLTEGRAAAMPGEFKGKIELDIRDSTPDWDAFLPDRAPEGAPNVLVVLYDDTGLAAWSPFGGLVLDLGDSTDLDVETLDMLRELTDALAAEGIELRLASVRSQARELLARSGLAARVRMERTIDAALT